MVLLGHGKPLAVAISQTTTGRKPVFFKVHGKV
jgi:hypothetical protein